MKFNIEVDQEQLNKILSALNDSGDYNLTLDLCEQAGIGDVDSSIERFMGFLNGDGGGDTEIHTLGFSVDTTEAEEAIYALVDALDDLEEAYDRVSKKTGLV